jgi:hypothetical protein
MAERWWAIGLAVTAPVETLEMATLTALKAMKLEVVVRERTEGGLKIRAQARYSDIDIELDRLTRQTARIRVDATAGLALEDRVTAAEIVTQTARVMGARSRQVQPVDY